MYGDTKTKCDRIGCKHEVSALREWANTALLSMVAVPMAWFSLVLILNVY